MWCQVPPPDTNELGRPDTPVGQVRGKSAAPTLKRELNVFRLTIVTSQSIRKYSSISMFVMLLLLLVFARHEVPKQSFPINS